MGINIVFTPEQAFDAARAAQQNVDAPTAWEPIVPFGKNELMPFPLTAVPSWLHSFAEAVTAQCETPPDLVGVLLLAVVATAVAGKAQICPSPGWFEPLNLFCIVALPPASRKSAVFKLVTKPLHEYQRAENERLKPIIAHVESERRILKARLDAAEQSAAKTKTQDARNEGEAQAAHLAEQLAALKVPALLRLFTDDCTPERLVGLMNEHQGRMAVLSAEGGLFGTLAGRYNEKSTNIDAVLKGHAGDALYVDRVSRPPEYVENPALTLGLAVQPNILEGLASVPGFRGRGLLARFLYSLPASNIGFRPNKNPPIPPIVEAGYSNGMSRLLNMEVPTNQDDEPQPLTLMLEPDAAACFLSFRCAIEQDMRPGECLDEIDDWAGKMAGAVIRIAGLLHLVEHGDTCQTVSISTLTPAIALGKYFMQHTLAAFDLMGADPEIEDARYILRWIERTHPGQFTQRDAHNALQGRFKRVDALERALRILAERHYVRPVDNQERGGPGRKPSAAYDVNPALHNLQNIQK
jgi:replicative DNA helicase